MFCAPAEGVNLEFGTGTGSQKKLEWRGYRVQKKFDDIFSHVEHQRDGQTDGRTDTGRQQRPRLRIASPGKHQV